MFLPALVNPTAVRTNGAAATAPTPAPAAITAVPAAFRIRFPKKNTKTSEKIATDIVNLALTIQSEKTKVFISGLTIRNDNLDKRHKDVNQLLKRKCLVAKLGFIDN